MEETGPESSSCYARGYRFQLEKMEFGENFRLVHLNSKMHKNKLANQFLGYYEVVHSMLEDGYELSVKM